MGRARASRQSSQDLFSEPGQPGRSLEASRQGWKHALPSHGVAQSRRKQSRGFRPEQVKRRQGILQGLGVEPTFGRPEAAGMPELQQIHQPPGQARRALRMGQSCAIEMSTGMGEPWIGDVSPVEQEGRQGFSR